MKKLVVILAFAVGLSLVTGIADAADKFAYVDLSRIFSEYNKTKTYDTGLGEKEKVYTKDREKKVGEIKAFQDKMDLLSDKEKEEKKAELESRIKGLQEFDREKQTDLRKEQDEKMKEILKDIEDAVKQYSEKQGYTMVFNDRVLVYQTKNLDITDKIIEILNDQYKK